jgi:hypothetical protein
VLDFSAKRSKRTPNYLGRREQWRLLFLVLSLGLVMLLIGQAGRAERWQWLWAAGGNVARDDGAVMPRAAKAPARPGGPELLFPGVRAELLRDVRDDTPFRSDEADAFYHLLGILADTPAEAIDQASTGHVTRSQLFAQPREYRGDLVSIRGVLRRGSRLQAAANDYGIGEFFQLWIQPADEADPMVAWCLEPPRGLAGRMRPNETADFDEPIELSGFFYKRWAYLAGDGIRTAPLILARNVHWEPPPAARPAEPAADMGISSAVLLAFGLSLAVVLLIVARTPRRARCAFGKPAADLEAEKRLRHELNRLAREQIPHEPSPDASS